MSLLSGISIILVPSAAFADAPKPCDSGYAHPLDSNGNPLSGCAKIKTNAECPSGHRDPNDKTKCAPLGSKPVALKDNPIVKRLNSIVNVLGGLVGVVVVGTIILGGIQYAAAGDKAEAVSAAKKRIINSIIALVVFLFIFAFLQWLIPGGAFG